MLSRFRVGVANPLLRLAGVRLCVFDGGVHCFRPLKARSSLPDGFSCRQVLHLQREQNLVQSLNSTAVAPQKKTSSGESLPTSNLVFCHRSKKSFYSFLSLVLHQWRCLDFKRTPDDPGMTSQVMIWDQCPADVPALVKRPRQK